MVEEEQIKKLKHVEVVNIPGQYEVRREDEYEYKIFENREEAIKFAIEENEKKEREIKLRENDDFFKIKLALFIRKQLGNYVEKLKKDLRCYRKHKGISKEETEKIEEIRKVLKEIIKDLTDIYQGEVGVRWHDDFFRHTTFYTIEKIDKETVLDFSTFNKIIENVEEYLGGKNGRNKR